MIYNLFLFITGVALLYLASNWLVKGAASLSFSLSIRPIIVGVSIVSFATSAPEFFVSLIAAIKGSIGISIGNVIGSNIMNIAVGIGLSAVLIPFTANKESISFEPVFMIGITLLFWILCVDNLLDRRDGAVLILSLLIFLIYSAVFAKNKKSVPVPAGEKKYIFNLFLITVGIAGLITGANLIVKVSVFIARLAGLSEIFIGASVAAVGTSMPEIATSIAAIRKGEEELSVGTVIGSNIFNICLVMGTIGLINPIRIDPSLNNFDFPTMMFLAALLFVFLRGKSKIGRIKGSILLSVSFAYIAISYFLNNAPK